MRPCKLKMEKVFLGLLLFAVQIYGDCRIYTGDDDSTVGLFPNGRSQLARGPLRYTQFLLQLFTASHPVDPHLLPSK